jgi:hypothetical protein
VESDSQDNALRPSILGGFFLWEQVLEEKSALKSSESREKCNCEHHDERLKAWQVCLMGFASAIYIYTSALCKNASGKIQMRSKITICERKTNKYERLAQAAEKDEKMFHPSVKSQCKPLQFFQ